MTDLRDIEVKADCVPAKSCFYDGDAKMDRHFSCWRMSIPRYNYCSGAQQVEFGLDFGYSQLLVDWHQNSCASNYNRREGSMHTTRKRHGDPRLAVEASLAQLRSESGKIIPQLTVGQRRKASCNHGWRVRMTHSVTSYCCADRGLLKHPAYSDSPKDPQGSRRACRDLFSTSGTSNYIRIPSVGSRSDDRRQIESIYRRAARQSPQT